jgi:hypothetical protein
MRIPVQNTVTHFLLTRATRARITKMGAAESNTRSGAQACGAAPGTGVNVLTSQ